MTGHRPPPDGVGGSLPGQKRRAAFPRASPAVPTIGPDRYEQVERWTYALAVARILVKEAECAA